MTMPDYVVVAYGGHDDGLRPQMRPPLHVVGCGGGGGRRNSCRRTVQVDHGVRVVVVVAADNY